ncbi:MAG: hypothetical protein UU18_C0010G0006 [Parcubacteria group bacterium GW2011_GWB2_40_8]|nr:MAG: hypothetical protein UU18_C0010G0006 [Parcubacteria group bacterium GW2011_GWB2_40_8]KKR77437.1 MAG: hypothetical protein UU20_C0007G0007 [Parcubacteria group bacterium GW2011_GWE2_40_8]KKR80551.1 MAG: hypothetical protein UU28_C0037G0005 [Parcubacteria group bacterium GW2011_GWD2_40_9]
MNNSSEKLFTGSWIAFGRIFFGLLWLYEVIWGHNWKWGRRIRGLSGSGFCRRDYPRRLS